MKPVPSPATLREQSHGRFQGGDVAGFRVTTHQHDRHTRTVAGDGTCFIEGDLADGHPAARSSSPRERH